MNFSLDQWSLFIPDSWNSLSMAISSPDRSLKAKDSELLRKKWQHPLQWACCALARSHLQCRACWTHATQQVIFIFQIRCLPDNWICLHGPPGICNKGEFDDRVMEALRSLKEMVQFLIVCNNLKFYSSLNIAWPKIYSGWLCRFGWVHAVGHESRSQQKCLPFRCHQQS